MGRRGGMGRSPVLDLSGIATQTPLSCDRLEVGSDDGAHPANLGCSPKFVECPLAEATVVVERLNSHIYADLVPVAEAIGDSSGRRGNGYGNAFDFVVFQAGSECRSGKANNAQWGIINLRLACFPIAGQPSIPRRAPVS
jgi:hypothetical protein